MKEYVVLYEWTGENFSAYVPDLPGCAAAGDTLEETEALIREAISLYIEAAREAGEAVPPPTTQAGAIAVGE